MTMAPIPTTMKTMNAKARIDGIALITNCAIKLIKPNLAMVNAMKPMRPTPGNKFRPSIERRRPSIAPRPSKAKIGNANFAKNVIP